MQRRLHPEQDVRAHRRSRARCTAGQRAVRRRRARRQGALARHPRPDLRAASTRCRVRSPTTASTAPTPRSTASTWSSSGRSRLRLASGDELTADQIVSPQAVDRSIPEIDGLDDIRAVRKSTPSDTMMRDRRSARVDGDHRRRCDRGRDGTRVLGARRRVIDRGVRPSIPAPAPRTTTCPPRSRSSPRADGTSGRSGRRRRSSATPDGVRLHVEDADGDPDGHVDAEIVLIAVGRVLELRPARPRRGRHRGPRRRADRGRRLPAHHGAPASSRSATCRAVGSSSTSPTTRRGSSSTTCTHPDAMEKADHRFVPHAVFSDPQVASVGQDRARAGRGRTSYVAKTQRYGDVAYGWAMEDTTGFVKVLADPASGQILGAHMLGADASSLIQPIVQAMSFGLSARDMGRRAVLDPSRARRSGRKRRSRPSARLNPSSQPGSTGAMAQSGRSRAHDPSRLGTSRGGPHLGGERS